MTELTLFDFGVVPEPGPKLGEDARRTLRQAQAMEHGSHPLALLGSPLRLHPDAPAVDDYEDSAVYPLMLAGYRHPLAVARAYLGENGEAGHA